MDFKQASDLLRRYQSGNINQSEKELVECWYQQLVETGEGEWDDEEKELLQHTIESGLLKKINDDSGSRPIQRLNRRWWVAASFVFLLGFAKYLILFNNRFEPVQSAKTPGSPDDVQAPKYNKAIITLANGKKIYPDSMSNGAAVVLGNTRLVKLANGEIAYQHSGMSDGEMQFNTLVNPRGSKVINMALSDGSKVWLNAGSSLTYPIAFSGSKREVTVTGEVYFEVAHDKSHQFIVHKGAMDVEVMGTHFNVNAFEDDDITIKVTLLEGLVKVKNKNSNGLLKPGQQALVYNEVKVVSNVDIDQVMAWKNGYFQFENASLQSVLKQVARWYDVEVIYEGKNQNRRFVGEIERDLRLSDVLRILEMNKVSFKIAGKRLFVNPD